MKKNLIVLAICLVISAAMCLSVSWPSDASPMPTTDSTLPSSGTASTQHGSITGGSSTQQPIPHAVRLYICSREDAARYEALATAYTAQTGVTCQILTGDLDTLMDSETPPTVFCIHSQDAAQKWQTHCYDLSDTAVLGQLYNPGFALTVEGVPLALAMDVTGYGIVYNAALLARVGYTREDFMNWDTFLQPVEAITAEKNYLGFSAFSTPDFSGTQLAALIAGSGNGDSVRSLLDLILANDVQSDNALEAFLAEKTVFYIAGAWDYDSFSPIGFHNLDILPFYTADGGSIPCICSHYLAVNALTDGEDISLSLDFLNWLVTAGTDGATPVDSLGVFAPFREAAGGENVFMQILMRKHLARESVAVSWSIAGGMTQSALNELSIALQNYIASPSDQTWEMVRKRLP